MNSSFVLTVFLFSGYAIAIILSIMAKFEVGVFKQPELLGVLDITDVSQTFKLDPKCKKVAYICVVPQLPYLFYPYKTNVSIMVAVFDKITHRSRFQEQPFIWQRTRHDLKMPTSADCFIMVKLDKVPCPCKAYVYGHR